ncbi:MAG: DUF3341 domain-containing protein [Planctomycetaceae bacterium]|nr:DUF3341 domain-containing protein [Planctomycetaceae bacterium]
MSAVVDPHGHSADAPVHRKPELAGYVARFSGQKSLMEAARKTRDAGFKRFDCYVPYPIHGLDHAMGMKPTRLPFIVLGCAVVGLLTAVLLQWFTNAFDYKYIISGKPYMSIPSSMPVNFELAVLFSAFGALFGMLALNQLPKFYNRLFLLDPFQKVTTNGFFLGIEAADPKFHSQDTKAFLENLKPLELTPCMEPHADARLPRVIAPIAVLLLVVGLIPLVLAARMRAMPSNVPRIELIHDMDFQPKLKTQRFSSMFADGRGMRPVIAGTLARGDLRADAAFYEGLIPDQADGVDRALLLPNAKNPDGTTVQLDQMPWVSEIPLPVDAALMERGRERYNIYCSVCHGLTGKGDGLVTLRAMELQRGSPGIGTWINPISLSADPIRQQRVGQLFNSITHGVRKMPAYGSQIPESDRWAIVLYVRALQRAGSGTLEDVPEELKAGLTAAE